MSMRCLLEAVRDRIRTALDLDDGTCLVTFDGQPPPNAGQVFYGVTDAGYRNQDMNSLSLDEYYSVNVVLTMRTSFAPTDRYGEAIMTNAIDGMHARMEALRVLLHQDYTSMNAANTLIGASENGFIEPLKFSSVSIRTVGPDWFWSNSQSAEVAGLVATLQFVDARRVQVLEEQS